MTDDDRNQLVQTADSPLPPAERALWRDPTQPSAERVRNLLEQMTLEEKLAQIYAVWLGAEDGGEVAPHQHDMVEEKKNFDWERLIKAGLGQLTRPFGTAPVDPATGARRLARLQSEIIAAGRFGIPAIAHEECLTGWTTLGATIYPTALAWGATFHPELVERMATEIGTAMRSFGVHVGLSPVMDVTRDLRWGRTEETIGEDPYLVGTVGTAYVKGLQSGGVHATLKHFAGYSSSRAGRNFGPVSTGWRELAELLLPFEMAVRDGGARSIMASYAAVDGIPAHAHTELLTKLLRDEWGFDGTVVADYFGVTFLETLHGVVADPGDAAHAALAAGLDVELPMVRCYGDPLLAAVRSGEVAESLVDRAAHRVLLEKCELGLLDPDWNPTPPVLSGAETSTADGGPGPFDLDPPRTRELARQLAEESIVLLANSGSLPLAPEARLAVVGPLADDGDAMLGCYTFPRHVGLNHPEHSGGVQIRTLLESLREELPGAAITHASGCEVDGTDRSGFTAAVEAATSADVCVMVLGDRAGLFGKGTSGEGCDVADLALPGLQGELLNEVLETGTPVVLVVLSGRPYALGSYADRLAAVVQGFFPGEEGGAAVAAVLSGRVCPSGRLPVSVPRSPGGQPNTYLAPQLGHRTNVSSVDPTPLYPFGHGLSYTTFTWEDVRVNGREVPADQPVEFGPDQTLRLSVDVCNTGSRDGTEVVQLYLHDPVAQVNQPVVRLIGYARVAVQPGQRRRVEFEVHTDTFSFVGRSGKRVVEPGEVELRISASSADARHIVRALVGGEERVVGHDRRMTTTATVA